VCNKTFRIPQQVPEDQRVDKEGRPECRSRW
jgi:hypothetical protein